MTLSIEYFNSIINWRCFSRTSIVLSFTKFDLFKEKIKTVPLERSFPDYEGGADANNAARYILSLYMKCNRAKLFVYPLYVFAAFSLLSLRHEVFHLLAWHLHLSITRRKRISLKPSEKLFTQFPQKIEGSCGRNQGDVEACLGLSSPCILSMRYYNTKGHFMDVRSFTARERTGLAEEPSYILDGDITFEAVSTSYHCVPSF